jgi:hypothetical protein
MTNVMHDLPALPEAIPKGDAVKALTDGIVKLAEAKLRDVLDFTSATGALRIWTPPASIRRRSLDPDELYPMQLPWALEGLPADGQVEKLESRPARHVTTGGDA